MAPLTNQSGKSASLTHDLVNVQAMSAILPQRPHLVVSDPAFVQHYANVASFAVRLIQRLKSTNHDPRRPAPPHGAERELPDSCAQSGMPGADGPALNAGWVTVVPIDGNYTASSNLLLLMALLLGGLQP